MDCKISENFDQYLHPSLNILTIGDVPYTRSTIKYMIYTRVTETFFCVTKIHRQYL